MRSVVLTNHVGSPMKKPKTELNKETRVLGRVTVRSLEESRSEGGMGETDG